MQDFTVHNFAWRRELERAFETDSKSLVIKEARKTSDIVMKMHLT